MNKGRIPGRTKSRPIIARRCANVMWVRTRLFEYRRLSTLPSCSHIIASSQPAHLVWPLAAHWEEGATRLPGGPSMLTSGIEFRPGPDQATPGRFDHGGQM